MQNINIVVITGNLTKDPELRNTKGGRAICELRVAVNSRRKEGSEWVDKPNYLDVTVFGARAEAAAKHLSKGSGIAVEGRLDHQEWDAKDGSGRRQAIKVIASSVQFLGAKPTDADAGEKESVPQEDREPVGAAAGASEEEIPF